MFTTPMLKDITARDIMAFLVIATACAGFLMKLVPADMFMTAMVAVVIAAIFGKQAEKAQDQAIAAARAAEPLG